MRAGRDHRGNDQLKQAQNHNLPDNRYRRPLCCRRLCLLSGCIPVSDSLLLIPKGVFDNYFFPAFLAVSARLIATCSATMTALPRNTNISPRLNTTFFRRSHSIEK